MNINNLTSQDIANIDDAENFIFNILFGRNDPSIIIKKCDKYNNNSNANNLYLQKINKNKLLFNLCEYNNNDYYIDCYKLVINFLINNKIYIEKQTCCEAMHNDYMIEDLDKLKIFIEYLNHCNEDIKMTFIDFNFRNTDNMNIRKYILHNYATADNINYFARHIEQQFEEINCPIYGFIGEYDRYYDILQDINLAQMLVKYMIKKYKKNVISDDAYIHAVIDYYHDDEISKIPYFTSLGYLLNETHYDYYTPSVYEFYTSQVKKIII
jgi:hypothetical protein